VAVVGLEVVTEPVVGAEGVALRTCHALLVETHAPRPTLVVILALARLAFLSRHLRVAATLPLGVASHLALLALTPLHDLVAEQAGDGTG
jgi:hypothetical protein